MSKLFNTEAIFNSSIYLENVQNRWKFLEDMNSESAVGHGYLIRSPIPVITFTSVYILFVCFIGPMLMRNREPFQLKTTIRFYNLLMVFLAAVLVNRLYDAVGSLGSMVDCNKTFTFDDENPTKIYRLANLILMVRLSEYLDTIFFTLRKKENQVTFLHVFHHAFVPMYAYWILRTGPLRFNVFIILINSFIHVLMYSYYFLATFQEPRNPVAGPSNRPVQQSAIMYIVTKLLMFKKYMTQLQILQFVSLAVYSFWAMVQPNRCEVPWTYIIANLLLAFGFLGLFLHFYMKVYRSGAAGRASSRPKRD